VTPNSDVVKIPEELQAEEVIGVGCAFRTVIAGFEKLGGIGIQSNVVVQGAGPIGLYSILLAAEEGWQNIVVVHPGPAELAKRWELIASSILTK